ncbi:MAG: ATP-dependent DNA helicase RecQ, partial [Candidatus Sericytochromatia bacterium]|nr:ATP-dependent DNA helicase RecQ [Candidatus Sericytochromatia bacterium]
MTLSPSMDAQLHEALERYFGFREFRDGQKPIIEAVLSGHDTLAIMPTGQGKSLCYQLPAMVLPGTTLVVSPLIALMKDQVDGLHDRGISATFINSTLDAETQRDRLDGMVHGRYKLVYIAPERFRSGAFTEAVRATQISLVAIDEAHCLSQWGHDFRPDYLKLAGALTALGKPQMLAATATATQEVRDDVLVQLGMRQPKVFVSGFDRPNLRYMVRYTPNEAAKLEKLAQIVGWATGGGIIYCATRKNVEKVAEYLGQHEQGVVAYHAGLDEHERSAAQDRFMSGKARIAVATNAFGMGIDRSDIRFVVHYDIPGTIEAYYQEAGRGGRDGRLSYCILMFQEADRYLQEFFIEGSSPGADVIQSVYDTLLAENVEQVLLSQVEIARRMPRKINDMAIGTCLNVLERMGVIARMNRQDNHATLQLIPWAQAHIKGKLQTQVYAALKDRFGDSLTVGVSVDLDGIAGQAGLTREQVHQSLKAMADKSLATYSPPFHGRGVLIKQRVDLKTVGFDMGFWANKRQREMNRLERMIGYAYSRQCRRRYILQYFGEGAGMDNCGSCDVCMGLAETPLSPADKAAKAVKKTKPAAGSPGGSASRLGDADPGVLGALKDVRTQLARERNLPAYVVATDAMLHTMAEILPTTETALLAVKGWGLRKLTLYGEHFLVILRELVGAGAVPAVERPPESSDTVLVADEAGYA